MRKYVRVQMKSTGRFEGVALVQQPLYLSLQHTHNGETRAAERHDFPFTVS